MKKQPKMFQSLKNRSYENDLFFNTWRRNSSGQNVNNRLSVNRRAPSNSCYYS